MFHSPFGGVALFLNILIICIGLISRFLNRHSIKVCNATKEFVNSFIGAENDTLLRRVFAGSILFSMFITITTGIVFVFVVLLNDERRVPLYTVLLTAYGYIANSKEGLWIAGSLHKPQAPTPAVVSETSNHDASACISPVPLEEPPAVITSTTMSIGGEICNLSLSTPYNKNTLDARSNRPHSTIDVQAEAKLLSQYRLVIFATSSKSLTELLKANNIDDSMGNKVKLADLLGLADYRGSSAEDRVILKKLKDIQGYNYLYNR